MSKIKKTISIVLVVALLIGTFAGVGSVLGFKAKAENAISFTGLDGVTITKPGNRGPLKTVADLNEKYGSTPWIYTATEAFELPGVEKIGDISSDVLNNLEPT
ncbi:MAG: hypothetical protein J5562_07445, partial [Clostridia bacterium]|nr:hypothetical protein [Clostridia bacterium]